MLNFYYILFPLQKRTMDLNTDHARVEHTERATEILYPMAPLRCYI